MIARGDIESVNLSTGECRHRVAGNGESTLESKEIGGLLHHRVRCWFCKQPIWVSHGRFSGDEIDPCYRCNDCNGKPNARRREYQKDAGEVVDLRYHGTGD